MRDLENQLDLAALVLPEIGRLTGTNNECEPYRLLDATGAVIRPVADYFAELQAADLSKVTVRSYGYDLLRWWRFLHVVDVRWDHVTRMEARDFMRWMLVASRPIRNHWRHRDDPDSHAGHAKAHLATEAVEPLTGKENAGKKYSMASRAHAETVLRAFYDFHLESGGGPIVNPFPLDRSRRAGRSNAHHNPLEPFAKARTGRYRPKTPMRTPRRMPDEQFDKIFAGLSHNRDRALLAFWISTAARAEELLGVSQQRADPGEQLIGVIRKGSRALQWLPASPDAFVWLRIHQEEIWRRGAPRGRNEPLWCTLRRPWRPLTYHAARAMFTRAQGLLGSTWNLHDLRHAAAYRMARDPEMPITDVQWVLGHANLSTTQIYTEPTAADVIASTLAHHRRQVEARAMPPALTAPPNSGYNPDSLKVLFG